MGWKLAMRPPHRRSRAGLKEQMNLQMTPGPRLAVTAGGPAKRSWEVDVLPGPGAEGCGSGRTGWRRRCRAGRDAGLFAMKLADARPAAKVSFAKDRTWGIRASGPEAGEERPHSLLPDCAALHPGYRLRPGYGAS
jgi:hypothetical protein